MRLYPPVPRPRSFTPQGLLLAVDVPAGAIRVSGELDRTSVHHLADALSALRSSPCAIWTLDLHGLSFCDVEGLRLLNRAVDLARSSGRGLHLIRISPAIADLLALLEEEPEDHAFLDPVRFQEPTTVS